MRSEKVISTGLPLLVAKRNARVRGVLIIFFENRLNLGRGRSLGCTFRKIDPICHRSRQNDHFFVLTVQNMYTNVRLHRLDFVQFMCGYVRLSAHFGETEKAKKPYKPYIKISVGPTLG